MKIFLDIDGVLNRYCHSDTTPEQEEHWKQQYPIHPECLENLYEALENCYLAHGVIVNIVISSAWRKLFKSRDEFKQVPHWAHWMELWLEENWRTPSSGRRGDEIDEWCRRNDYSGPIVVIDDEGCDLNGHQFLIKTAMYAGFTKLDGERLVNLVGVLNENRLHKRPAHGVQSVQASAA